jgi:hypothetical protein
MYLSLFTGIYVELFWLWLIIPILIKLIRFVALIVIIAIVIIITILSTLIVSVTHF